MDEYSVLAKFQADPSGYIKAAAKVQSATDKIGSAMKKTPSIASKGFGAMGKAISGVNGVANKLSASANNMGSRFLKATTETSGGFSRATSAAGSFSKQVMAQAAGIAVFKGIETAVQGVATALTESVKYYDQMTSFKNGLANLGVSTNEIQTVQNKLNTELKGTGVEATSATSAISALVSSGMNIKKATDTAIAFSKGMALTGTSAEGAEGFMRQYAQGVAKGKFELEDFNTMNENAPGILDQVAKSLLGASGNSRKLYEAMQDGKISVNQMNAAVVKLGQNKWADALKNQTLTVSQGMTEVKKSVLTMGSTFIEKVNAIIQKNTGLKGLGAVFVSLSQKVDGLNKKLQEVKPEQIEAAFKKVATAVTTSVAAIGTAMAGFQAANYFMKMTSGLMVAEQGMIASFNKMKAGIFNFSTSVKTSTAGIRTQFANMTARSKPFIDDLSKSFDTYMPRFKAGTTKFVGAVKAMTIQMGTAFGTARNVVATGTKGMIGAMNIGLKAIAPAIVVTTLLAGLGVAYQQYGTQINKFIQTSIQKGPEIINKLTEGIVQRLPSLVNSGVQMLGKIVEGINANLPAILNGATRIITTMVNSLIQNMPQLVQQGLSLVANLAQGIANNLPTLIQKGVELVASFVMTIGQNLPQIIQKGTEILTSLASGIGQKLPEMITTAGKAILTFVQGIIKNLPKIAMAGVKIIVSLLDGIMSKIPGVSKVWNKIKSKIDTGNKEIEANEKRHASQMASTQKKMADNAEKQSSRASKAQSKNASSANKGVTGSYAKMDASTMKTMESMTTGVNLNSKEQTKTVSSNAAAMTKNVGKSYSQMAKETSKAAANMTKSFDTGFDKMSDLVKNFTKNATSQVTKAMNQMTKAITSGMNTSKKATQNGMNAIKNAMSQSFNNAVKSVRSAMTAMLSTVRNHMKSMLNSIRGNLNAMVTSVRSGFNRMTQSARNGSRNIRNGVVSGMGSVRGAISRTMTSCVNAVRSRYSSFWYAGRFIMSGLQAGINSRAGGVYARVNRIASNIARTFRKAMRIHSPSRVMKELGVYTAQGVAVGIDKGGKDAVISTQNLAKRTANAFDANFTGSRSTSLSQSYSVGPVKQPAYITIKLGDTEFKRFVDDISKQQGFQGSLNQAFGI